MQHITSIWMNASNSKPCKKHACASACPLFSTVKRYTAWEVPAKTAAYKFVKFLKSSPF